MDWLFKEWIPWDGNHHPIQILHYSQIFIINEDTFLIKYIIDALVTEQQYAALNVDLFGEMLYHQGRCFQWRGKNSSFSYRYTSVF